ncbi:MULTISPECIES: hypothetical protein [unclassified Streptomyces]|nr:MULTISPECIES: hypothetical protein [unclassified Streptomyces]
MWRTSDGVRLQARSGRDVTAAWGDLALAGHHLPAGTVLDGEAVITTEDGRISFEAAQARAASSPWPPSAPPTTSPSTPCNCPRRTGTYERGRTASAAQPSSASWQACPRTPRSRPSPPPPTATPHSPGTTPSTTTVFEICRVPLLRRSLRTK